ncbi:MAG: hypothetical protein AAFU73_02825 [Planctomycetota bacterium]
MKNLLLAAAAIALLASNLFAVAQDLPADPSPVPNQECGTEVSRLIPKGTAISGTGADDVGATQDGLMNASGAVCQICDGGVQCPRSVTATNILVIGRYFDQPNGTVKMRGRTTNDGFVTILCADC